MDINELPFLHILDKLYDGVYVVDVDRRILYWNDGAERLSGYAREEMIGSHCWDNKLLHVDGEGVSLCHGQCPLVRTIGDGQDRENEVFLHHCKGHRVPVSVRVVPLYDVDGAIKGAVEIFSDNMVREDIMSQIEQLERLAMLDPLTELGNRRYAEQQLDFFFAQYHRQQTPFGVLFIDIDRFKSINDRHGHDTGDQVLTMVAKTLTKNLRNFDVVCRWGGEEFVALVHNVNNEQLQAIAEKLRMLTAESHIVHDDQPLRVTISLGGTLVQNGDTPALLIERADKQMYRAKNLGRNQARFG